MIEHECALGVYVLFLILLFGIEWYVLVSVLFGNQSNSVITLKSLGRNHRITIYLDVV